MKFTCERDAIFKEIGVAQEVVSSRNALSILSNVLFQAENNTLTIRATDLKVSFETRVPVEVSVPGTTTVYCDKLLGILRSLPSGEVEFEQGESEQFTVRPVFKKADFRLKSIASDRFPEIPSVADDQYFSFPQKELIEMISQTVFAVSDDETRYFMNGVFMEYRDASLIMVATDGRRLSYIKKPVDLPFDEMPGVIIPPKILSMIRKLASGEGSVSLAVTEKNVFAQFDNQRISSALIEGQFPNYDRVIPANQEHRLQVSHDELGEALKRVSLMVEKSRRIYMTLSSETLTLRSEESDIGVANEEIACTYDGPETTIALNYLYLSEPLRVIGTENVSIEFTEPNKAVTLYPAPRADYFHIVMPMQLD
jgi:DNA polymerase-3 subunit beta